MEILETKYTRHVMKLRIMEYVLLEKHLYMIILGHLEKNNNNNS